MRIPSAYLESMIRRYKKNKIENEELSIDNTTLSERLKIFMEAKKLNDPSLLNIISETIDRILEAATQLFKDENSSLCVELLGQCDPLQIWELSLQCCDVIMRCGNQKLLDMIFSYEHLLTLIFYNPEHNIHKTYKFLQCLQFLIESMNTSKANKFKVDQFERIFLKFLYVNAFFQKSVYNLSIIEQQELYQFPLDNQIIKLTLPCDELNSYVRYVEQCNLRKIPQQQPMNVEITIQQNKNAYEQCQQIVNEYKISKDSILYDQIYIRLLCNNCNDEQLLQKLFIKNYIFHVKCGFNELQIINNKYLLDITNRLIDQKDYLFLLIRMIVVNKDEVLEESLVESLQYIKLKQVQLFEQNTFLEKLWLFELQGIQDTLIDWKQLLQIEEGNYYENRIKLNVKLQQLFFQQLTDQQFTQLFKKQPNYQQWNHLIIAIIRKSQQNEETKLPYYIINPLLSYCVNLIIELPINNQNQTLDYHLEFNIIQGLIEVIKNNQISQQLLIRTLQLLNQLVNYYKSEFDQVQIQNAQSEFMMPVPERYHKLLGEIWSNKILENLLQNNLNEQLYTHLISLLATTMGENPARVREFNENKSLKLLIDKIIELLKTCSRSSPLIVTVINLLIAISTNEDAISLTLQTNDQQQDNLIKKIFVKCYLPSIELLHDPSVSDDFAKKIIMLYSQSMMAKKQIEKVIENTFVTISQLVDLSKDNIEEIVSNSEKLQSFYSYSKSLQALLQLFVSLQQERRSSYRQFQGYEDLQLEEAQRQKDQLFNSLLKNNKFVEAIEKIIMSPILIGSKSKDSYVEQYVTALCKKNKLNPYVALCKELDLIQQNYMIIGNQKIIDIGKLVDYDALQIHMSDKYFFRKIIKHISPQTYRGFYILSRFHLIHYLIKMCNSLGQLQGPDMHLLITQLLEIYFLSSQHAGFHESIMMLIAAKQQLNRNQPHYDEENQIRRRISKDNLIPLQSSCLELTSKIQQIASLEQREFIVRKYGEIIQLFFQNISERFEQLTKQQDIQIIQTVTYLQDMLKSARQLLNQLLNLEQQLQPIFFTQIYYQNKEFFLNLIKLLQHLDYIQKHSNSREQDSVKKILPGFNDAIYSHVDIILKQSLFRQISISKITIGQQQITDPQQLEQICNEYLVAQASLINEMIEILLYNPCEGILKNLLEQLITKLNSIKDIQLQDLRRFQSDQKEQPQQNKDIVQLLQGNDGRGELRKSLFDKPEIKSMIDSICEMGFTQQQVKKAIQRIEIPEPTMIISMLVDGRISDDEEEQDDFFDQALQDSQIIDQLAQDLTRKQLEQEKQQEQQKQQQDVILDKDQFTNLLVKTFPLYNSQQTVQERINLIISQFQNKLDQSLNDLMDKQLNNQRQNNHLLEYLFTIVKKQQPINKILDFIFSLLNKPQNDVSLAMQNYTKVFQWMNFLQCIAQPEHEKIYQHVVLIDQEPSKDLKYHLSFQKMLTIGFALSEQIQNQFVTLANQELEQLKQLVINDSQNYQATFQQVQTITNNLNILFDNKQTTLKLFCKELSEIQKYLSKFVQNQQNKHDQLIERYWDQIEIYLQFLIQICSINLTLQECTQQVNNLLSDWDENLTQKLQNERDQSQNIVYFRQLIQRRFYLDKQIIIQLLQCLNNFGIHRQHKLFDYLTKNQQNKSLLLILFQLKAIQSHMEYEESQPVYLENLIYLIGIDQKTSSDLILQLLRQIMLNEHIDYQAQQLKGTDELTQIQIPQKYIETPLQYLMTSHPTLINNPIVYNTIIEQNGLSITDKFTEINRVHVKPPPPTKPPKDAKEVQQQPQNDVVLRYEIAPIEYTLNKNFLEIINIIIQTTVDRFFEENCRVLEQIFNVKYENLKDDNKIYLYGWDQLLRILEMLILQIPQLILHIREIKVKLPFNEESTFIEFLIKYLTWVGAEKLTNFMHNYLSDINLMSFSYGISLGQEVLQLLLKELNFEQQNMKKFYHILQLIILFTQTLTLQNCSLILSDQISQLNIIPQLVQTLNQIKQCENKQFIKLYHQTITRILEPFLQSQIYYTHLQTGRFGDILRLQQQTSDPFQYHYLHCLKNQLVCYLLYPNFKSTVGSAQHFISHQYQQSTLKDEYQQETQWPLYQSRKNYTNQRQNNQKQAEEDQSDSDSDQDIFDNNIPARFRYANSWGAECYYDNSDFTSKYGRDEERNQRENQQNIFPQSGLNILFCIYNQQLPQFTIPKLTINENIQYIGRDHKQWICSIVGLFFSTNEYFENKKQLISKAYENSLKFSVEYIQQLNRILLSQTHRNRSLEIHQDYQSYYLNGALNFLQPYTSISSFYSKFGSAPNQQSQDYLANSLPINVNDSQLQLQRVLSQITININQSRVVINGMPSELQDQNLMRAKLQSLLHNEELTPTQSLILQIPKKVELLINEQDLATSDELILEIFVNLLLDQQSFPQFPFSLLRQVCKCQRLGNKMLSLLLDLFKENKNNLDFTLKILYLVSQKIPSHNLRDLLSEQLLVSPILNRREKANLAKVVKQVVIEEEENVDEQSDESENPLVFLINQINSYCEKNIAFIKSFHNPESYIPLEKNILLTPLLQNQTSMHLSYLIQIIRGSLTIVNEESKEKGKKYEDDYNSKFTRRPATVLSQNNFDDSKFFDIIAHFKTDDINLQQMLQKSFPNKFLDSEKSDFLFAFSNGEQSNLFKPQIQSPFQQPSQNVLPILPPDPPVPPIPSISILQQQQQSLLHYQQLRQQHQQQQSQYIQQQVQQEQYHQHLAQMQFHQKKIQLLQQQQQLIQEQQINEEKIRQQQQINEERLRQQIIQSEEERLRQLEDEPEIKRERKVSAKISHMEIDIITALCQCLSNPLLRDNNSNELANILNSYANDKLKIEHSINQLTNSIIYQAKTFNHELDKKRKQIREITLQKEKNPAYDPEQNQSLSTQDCEIIKELNQKTPEPNVIQRCFNAIIGFLNMQFTNEQQAKQTGKPSSTQTRNQIQQDKKRHKLQQQGKLAQDEQEIDAPSKKEIKMKFINILQTKQTHHLWLNVVETLLLIFNYSGHRSIEYLQKKLYPLLECFIKLYQNVHEDQFNNESSHSDQNFFERNLSGSASSSLQFGMMQFQKDHLQRSFSAVRNENEMQMKIDELFTYLCIKGKRVINYLISSKLSQMTLDIKQSQSQNSIKYFKENDPLGFVFFKMSNIVSFENKKHFFELDLEALKATEKPQSSRSRSRPSETIEITIVRDTRLQQSLEKVLNIDKNKLRRCEIKVRYQGERGQDEGGIRKEWMTNLVKDILQTDKFELNPKRFYKILPNKKQSEDLNHFRLLGKIIAKSIYDGLLLPVYFIPPIFKLILQKNPTIDDLEHYNEGYYDTFIKFTSEETQVQYKDLFEFWIPEEYANLIDQHKKQIFTEILQDYLEKNPIEVKQDQKEEQQDKKTQPENQLEVPLLKKESQSDSEKTQQINQQFDQVPPNEEKVQFQEKYQPLPVDEQKQQKQQGEEINKEDLENREKKRLVRKNKKKQLSDETLKLIKIQDVFSKLNTLVSMKHKRQICELISKRIMIEEIKPQIQSLRDGFFDILSKEYFSYMDWRDLQKLIIGVPSVDVDDLQANTEYVNYDKNNQTVLWFWEVLKTLSDSEKADFLMFATGSPLVPFGGFKNLRGHNGPRKFSISKDFNQDHFIKAHACFNRIDLPEYNSKEMLREKLLKSLKESGSGFDLS